MKCIVKHSALSKALLQGLVALQDELVDQKVLSTDQKVLSTDYLLMRTGNPLCQWSNERLVGRSCGPAKF